VLATALLGGVWAVWHLPLAFVDPRFPHGFTSTAPQILLAAVAILIVASRALLAYDAAPERGPDKQPAGG
jgi:hypothetical protein